MRITRSQKIINLLEETKKVTEKIKELEKKEKEMKSEIYAFAESEDGVKAGRYVAIIKEITRMNIDAKKLMTINQDIYNQCLNPSTYKTIQIKVS